jgi:hypothetical protein
MFAKQIVLSLTALLALHTVAAAQIVGGSTGTMSSGTSTPPTLPSVEYSNRTFSRTIGNTWLGGTAYAYAGLVRQKQGTYELGSLTGQFRVNANVLKQSLEVAEIYGNASNVMNNGVQSRSGLYRLELLGFTLSSNSFTNSSTFASASSTYNLFPGTGISASVPLAVGSVTLRGNAGCGFSRSANWLLPAATATVGLNATATAYAYASTSVSYGIPGFNVGVGLRGQIAHQTLSAGASASAVWGLTGNIGYTLRAIDLYLYVWATALYTWDTTLCSWSSGATTFDLF